LRRRDDMLPFFHKPGTPAISPLTADHSADCAELHAMCFAHPWCAEDFAALLNGAGAIGEAAVTQAGRVSGFVLSRRAADEAEILSLAVAPQLRRAGLGSVLLSRHLARLAALGVAALFLEVEDGNKAAQALYRHFQFAVVGERKAYYRGPDGTRPGALVMRRSPLA